jgi:hypothetical protein
MLVHVRIKLYSGLLSDDPLYGFGFGREDKCVLELFLCPMFLLPSTITAFFRMIGIHMSTEPLS